MFARILLHLTILSFHQKLHLFHAFKQFKSMTNMTSNPLVDEEEYVSEEDSDFAPDAAPAGDAASGASDSESEDEDNHGNSVKPGAKRKRPTNKSAGADNDDGFDNSGDEAVIGKSKKRQKKAGRKDGAARDEDGEDGLVKTRSMRAAEKPERAPYVATEDAPINVDVLWDKMLADSQDKRGADSDTPAMIRIKRTYNFAGQVHTEEKLVPRDSAEAKVYLATLDPTSAEAAAALGVAPSDAVEDPDAHLKRRPRKAFRSAFEPVVEGAVGGRRADLDLGMAVRLRMREQRAGETKAKKLNVVEKSRMDWAGFVDQEGLKDELELAGRSKHSYANRQDFLARVDAYREEDARRARAATRAA